MTNDNIVTESDRMSHMLDVASITEHIAITGTDSICQSNLIYNQMSDRFRNTFMLGPVNKDTDYQ